MLRFKPDVRIGDMCFAIVFVFAECCLWSFRAGVDVEVNSVEDPAPGRVAGSLHAFGLAVDVDTVGDVDRDTAALGEWLRRRLPPDYDVVLESTHVHVEFDAHRPPLTKVAG